MSNICRNVIGVEPLKHNGAESDQNKDTNDKRIPKKLKKKDTLQDKVYKRRRKKEPGARRKKMQPKREMRTEKHLSVQKGRLAMSSLIGPSSGGETLSAETV